MIMSPMNNPAFNSSRVMPRKLRIENSATMLAAAIKRNPTKNRGPLAVKAFCTSRNAFPHTIVIRISTYSALLIRDVKNDSLEAFNGVTTLRVINVRHNAPKLSSILRSVTKVSNIVPKENSQRASVLQHVSQNVRRLRLLAQLSQRALAESSGVSRRMLVAIEAGEKNVDSSTLDRVAEALDVAFSDLIQAPGSPDPGRINEVAWSGCVPGSKAVLLAQGRCKEEVELWEWRLEPGEEYLSEADADGWSEQLYIIEVV